MPKLRVHNIAMSVDGYAAGPHQDVEHPLGTVVGMVLSHTATGSKRTRSSTFRAK